MYKAADNRKGFTLVEVIVVLVILAILAAIMIPAMTGWIDRAREKRLIVACRSCVNAAQTIASEAYGINETKAAPAEGDVLKLAGVNGEVSGISMSDKAAVDRLTYSDGSGESVTYFRLPNPHYEFGAGGGAGGGITADTSTLNQKITDLLDFAGNATITVNGKETPFLVRIDSASPANDNTFLKAMQTAAGWENLELAGVNINTWSIQKEGKTNIVWFSDQDLSQYNVGDSVRTIRYNSNTGTYAAGYLKVIKNSGTNEFQRIANASDFSANWVEQAGQDAEMKKDAGKIAEVFNGMPAKKE